MDKIRPNKKIVLSVLGVLVVLVVAAGAGIGLRLLQNDKAAKNADSEITEQPLPESVREAQNLGVSGDTEGALNAIDKALADGGTPNEEKYQLYIQQGNAYYNSKDIKAAITSYETAEKIDGTYEIVSLLATVYEEDGNKAKAIEYHKKSIPLIPESPMQQYYKSEAERKIQELEGRA